MTAASKFHHAWRNLPIGALDDILGGGTCLILAPHPDDESLGCGGLIGCCVTAGRMPLVVMLTDGAGSHPNSRMYPPQRLRAVRAQEVRSAAGYLGLPSNRILFLDEPDTAAPRVGPGFDAVVTKLTKLIRQDPGCTTILAPWRYDPHCDHEAASMIAAKVAADSGVRHIAYPVWGWTLPADFPVPVTPAPGWRLDIQAFLSTKQKAIQAHRSQYGALITDDPTGFRLPTELLSVFETPYETFLEP